MDSESLKRGFKRTFLDLFSELFIELSHSSYTTNMANPPGKPVAVSASQWDQTRPISSSLSFLRHVWDVAILSEQLRFDLSRTIKRQNVFIYIWEFRRLNFRPNRKALEDLPKVTPYPCHSYTSGRISTVYVGVHFFHILQSMLGDDIESVKLFVRAAIDPAKPPNRTQVSELCRLTHFDESRKEIQRVVLRRLKYPYSYPSLEVLHTLQLLQNCLSDASSDFVNFCMTQAELIGSLQHYEGGRSPAALEIVPTARILSKVLNEFVPRPHTQKAVFGSKSYKSVSFLTPRHDSTKQKEIQPNAWTVPKSISPAPPRRHDTIKSVFQPDNLKGNLETSASVLLFQKEKVVTMTYQSGNEGLDAVLNAVDELIIPVSSFRSHPDELNKALKCVFHCLYWGSAPFVERCREKQKIFSLLSQHHNPKVRGYADEVFMFLDKSSPIQEEGFSRYPLIPHSALVPSVTLTHSEVIRETDRQNFVLDPSLEISNAVVKTEGIPFAKGICHTTKGIEMVVIKFLRKPGTRPTVFHKRLNDELLAWRTLSHKNITPFYGVLLEDNSMGLVWHLHPNGNVLEYLKIHWDINPLHMLEGIADGLLYLHSQWIVHGDIRCENILVSDVGAPCLTDFHLFHAREGLEDKEGYPVKSLASLRWSAPEIWISVIGDSPISSKTEKSDIYALASTCIEMILLEAPYQGLSDQQVLEHVAIDKKFPERPSLKTKYFSNDLWDCLKSCWSTRPQDRPNIVAVRRQLAEIIDSDSRRVTLTKKVRFKWPW